MAALEAENINTTCLRELHVRTVRYRQRLLIRNLYHPVVSHPEGQSMGLSVLDSFPADETSPIDLACCEEGKRTMGMEPKTTAT